MTVTAEAVTQTEHQRMSWHQRQELNDRLRSETRRLNAEIAELTHVVTARTITRARRFKAQETRRLTEYETHFEEAKEILNSLPKDPDAAAHRLALHQSLKGNPDE